jgi:preprotein translocase subunit SecE
MTKQSMIKYAFVLGMGSIFMLLCWGVPHVLKNIVGQTIKWLFLKKKLENN